MKKINALLVLLISSLAITGISFIDGKIWDVVFIVVGLIAYALVGILFSIGILSTKKEGSDAYALFFFLLLLGGYAVYKGLAELRNWITSWPLSAKIAVPSTVSLFIIVGIVLTIMWIAKNKSRKNDKEIEKHNEQNENS